MDNATFHRSKKVTAYLKEAGIYAIYNIPYSPQYNPIERVWGIVKHHYKRRKLQIVAQNQKVNHQNLIRQCLDAAKADTVKKICSITLHECILKE
jgi:transposase